MLRKSDNPQQAQAIFYHCNNQPSNEAIDEIPKAERHVLDGLAQAIFHYCNNQPSNEATVDEIPKTERYVLD